MKLPCGNQAGDSGVMSYEILGPDTLVLEFADGRFRYVYDATNPGPAHVAEMIRLAERGRGLATYINTYLPDRYARRISLP